MEGGGGEERDGLQQETKKREKKKKERAIGGRKGEEETSHRNLFAVIALVGLPPRGKPPEGNGGRPNRRHDCAHQGGRVDIVFFIDTGGPAHLSLPHMRLSGALINTSSGLFFFFGTLKKKTKKNRPQRSRVRRASALSLPLVTAPARVHSQ